MFATKTRQRTYDEANKDAINKRKRKYDEANKDAKLKYSNSYYYDNWENICTPSQDNQSHLVHIVNAVHQQLKNNMAKHRQTSVHKESTSINC